MPRTPPTPIKPGQVWTPKRGTYSLRVLREAGTSGLFFVVQKFSPSGVYEPPVTGPCEASLKVSTIRADYRLTEDVP